MSRELYAALTNAVIDRGSNMSREIEVFLRENPLVQKYIAEIRAEPESGALAVNPNKTKAKIAA